MFLPASIFYYSCTISWDSLLAVKCLHIYVHFFHQYWRIINSYKVGKYLFYFFCHDYNRKTIWPNHFIWETEFLGRFSNFSYLSWIFSSRKFYLLQIIYNCNDQNLLDITLIFMSVFFFLCLAHHRHTHTNTCPCTYICQQEECSKLWRLSWQESRGFGKSILGSLLFDVILPFEGLLIWNQELRVWMGDYKMLCRSFRNQKKNFFGTFWGLIGKKLEARAYQVRRISKCSNFSWSLKVMKIRKQALRIILKLESSYKTRVYLLSNFKHCLN